MKSTFTIFGSVFALVSGVFFHFSHTYPGLLSAVLALIFFVAAIFITLHKNTEIKTSKRKGAQKVDFIGKRVVVKLGGEPPQDDPNEIVGEKIVVHVPDEEIGKYNRIVGLESSVTIGSDKKK